MYLHISLLGDTGHQYFGVSGGDHTVMVRCTSTSEPPTMAVATASTTVRDEDAIIFTDIIS